MYRINLLGQNARTCVRKDPFPRLGELLGQGRRLKIYFLVETFVSVTDKSNILSLFIQQSQVPGTRRCSNFRKPRENNRLGLRLLFGG